MRKGGEGEADAETIVSNATEIELLTVVTKHPSIYIR